MHFDVASMSLQKSWSGKHCARQMPPLGPSPPMSFESEVMQSKPLRQLAAPVQAAPAIDWPGTQVAAAWLPHSERTNAATSSTKPENTEPEKRMEGSARITRT